MSADDFPQMPEGFFKDLDYASKLQEQQELYRKKTRELLLSLLPVKDALEALQSEAAGSDQSLPAIDPYWCDRLALLDKQLTTALMQAGVSAIDSIGRTANPQVHHVVETEPVPPEEAEKIIRERLKGYYHNKQLLRRPEVIVGKK